MRNKQRDRFTLAADVSGRARDSDDRTDEQVRLAVVRMENMLLGLITTLIEKGVIADADLREGDTESCPTCGSVRREVRFDVSSAATVTAANIAPCTDPWHQPTESCSCPWTQLHYETCPDYGSHPQPAESED